MADKKSNVHLEIDDCLNESEYNAIDDWHLGGLGETLEKNWECRICGRSWREVYIYSCRIDNKTEKVIG